MSFLAHTQKIFIRKLLFCVILIHFKTFKETKFLSFRPKGHFIVARYIDIWWCGSPHVWCFTTTHSFVLFNIWLGVCIRIYVCVCVGRRKENGNGMQIYVWILCHFRHSKFDPSNTFPQKKETQKISDALWSSPKYLEDVFLYKNERSSKNYE